MPPKSAPTVQPDQHIAKRAFGHISSSLPQYFHQPAAPSKRPSGRLVPKSGGSGDNPTVDRRNAAIDGANFPVQRHRRKIPSFSHRPMRKSCAGKLTSCHDCSENSQYVWGCLRGEVEKQRCSGNFYSLPIYFTFQRSKLMFKYQF